MEVSNLCQASLIIEQVFFFLQRVIEASLLIVYDFKEFLSSVRASYMITVTRTNSPSLTKGGNGRFMLLVGDSANKLILFCRIRFVTSDGTLFN